MLGLAVSVAKGGASLLTYVKDNLKLYLDFKSNRSDELKFPSEGSTSFVTASSQYINIGVQSNLQFASGTYAVWIYPTGNGVIYSRYVNPSYDIRWEVSGTTILCAINSVNRVTTPADSITLNAWNHVAISISSSSILTYVNGSLIDTDSGLAINTNAVANKIGYGDFGTYFGGKMANLGAWSRILSQEEVESVMNKSYSQLGSVEKTSLVMWQSLDSASNGVVQPATGEVLGNEEITKSVTDSWAGNDVSVNEASSEQAYSGTQSLKFTTGTGAGAKGVTSNTFTSVQNALYKIDFWVYSPSSEDIEVYAAQGGGAGNSFSENITIATNQWVNVVKYYYEVAGGASSSLKFANNSNSVTAYVDNISLKRVTSKTGVVTGATTTTSVYGGYAPILHRAIDIAESFADAIGGGSASFNGSSDYIQTANNVDIIGAGERTFTLWVKPTAIDQYYEVIEWGGTGTTNATSGIYFISSKIYFYGWSSGDFDTGTAPLAEWQHLAVTYDGATVKVYQNSKLIGSGAESLNTANSVLKIGKSTSAFFSGNIAQVGLWQGVLTQAQIQSVMESTSYAKIPSDVKSTLGSELITNGTFDSNITGWSNFNSSRGDVIYSNNRLRIDNSTGTGNTVARISASFSSGKTYKVSFDYYHISGATGSTTNVFLGAADQVIPSITSGQTTTAYITATSNRSTFEIGYNGGEVYELDNISVKEVTNDLVNYWALDEEVGSDGNAGSGYVKDEVNNNHGSLN